MAKMTQEEFNKLPLQEQNKLNTLALQEHSRIIKAGKCIHDLSLPLVKTTCGISGERSELIICRVCEKVIKKYDR